MGVFIISLISLFWVMIVKIVETWWLQRPQIKFTVEIMNVETFDLELEEYNKGAKYDDIMSPYDEVGTITFLTVVNTGRSPVTLTSFNVKCQKEIRCFHIVPSKFPAKLYSGDVFKFKLDHEFLENYLGDFHLNIVVEDSNGKLWNPSRDNMKNGAVMHYMHIDNSLDDYYWTKFID